MPHEQSLNGQRFSSLRRIFALTQKDLAQQLEVGQSFLSQVERGLRPAPANLARTASSLFSLPHTFFLVRSTPLESGPATFRKTSRALGREDERIGELYNEASRLFRRVSEESGYRGAELPNPADYGDDPERVAVTMRAAAGLDDESPVPNVTRTLERLGFGVVDQLDAEREGSEHSGITRPSPLMERPLVALISNAPGGVKRLTLLHEAYHHIADRNLQGLITSSRSPEEQRAFRFAGAFLLPASVVRQRITEALPLHGYLAIKADYGITVSAATRRAKDLGVISSNRYKSLSIQSSSAGWRKNEPVDVPDERPMLFSQALRRVYGPQPAHAAAEAVGTSPLWIRQWARLDDETAASTVAAEVVDFQAARRRRQFT